MLRHILVNSGTSASLVESLLEALLLDFTLLLGIVIVKNDFFLFFGPGVGLGHHNFRVEGLNMVAAELHGLINS